jgi:ATP-binding cassette subfamily B protein
MAQQNNHANRRGGGHRGRIVEKPKDFKAALGKLALYSKSQLPLILFAVILAALAAVLTVIGPNQLKNITNYITEGLPNSTSLQEAATSAGIDLNALEKAGLDLSSLAQGISGQNADPTSIISSVDPKVLAAAGVTKESIAAMENYLNGLHVDMKGIVRVGTFLIVIYALSALFSFLQSYSMSTVTQRIARRMRGDIDLKINKIPLSYFTGHTSGDVLSRVTNDVDTVGQALHSSVANLVTAVTQMVGCLIMMYVTEWRMASAAVLCSLLGFILMAVIMKHSQKFFLARQQSLGALNGYVEEMYTGHDIVRVSGADKEVLDRFSQHNEAVREANWKSQFFAGMMQPMFALVGNIGYVAVCVVGALLAMNNTITFGVIAAFILYIRLFTSPLRTIGQGMNMLQSAAAAGERVFEFLGEPELPDEKGKDAEIGEIHGNVEFSHVSFSYPDDPKTLVIKDFSARVKAGQKIAIVGPTGAGKTTLVNLLMRFFEMNSGDILIDGTSSKELSRKNIHNMFGMVLQDTWLFEGTVKENLIYNTQGVSDEKMKEACKACGIHNFIKALPQGYDTVLSDATAISAGQKQLLTIARAIIQDNPMMILDEATSSVDTRTEVLTQHAMDHLCQGRTSFVIAHRLSTIKNSDKIFVVNHGDIVEQGSHEELLAQGGFYAELYNSQFEKTA